MKKIIFITLLLPFMVFAEDETAPEDEAGGVIVVKKQSADQACKDYLVEKYPPNYKCPDCKNYGRGLEYIY